MLEIGYTLLHPNAVPPERATPGAAGYDLRACLDAPLTVPAGGRALIPTGLAIALPSTDMAALVFARSGLALKQGLTMANGVGVVDSDYRGELCVPVVNLSDTDRVIQPGDRVAQLCLMPVYAAAFTAYDELPDTLRGTGGFGSTGRG